MAGSGNLALDRPCRVHLSPRTQGDTDVAIGPVVRASEKGRHYHVATVRVQYERGPCNQRLRSLKSTHDARIAPVEGCTGRLGSTNILRLDPVRSEQIRRRVIAAFLNWRRGVRGTLRQSVADGMLAPHDAFPLRPLGEHPVFLRRQCHAELAAAWRATDETRLLCPPTDLLAAVVRNLRLTRASHPPDAGLAEAELVPGHPRPEHQDAPPPSCPSGHMDGNPQTQLVMASVDARDQPAASPRPSLAATAFPYPGRSDMTTGGAARGRRLLDNFAWGTRTIGSLSTQWAAYVELAD
jgi:hypothetical protein